MPKIKNIHLIYVLAFFILETVLLSPIVNAQDTETLDNGLRIIIEEDHRNPLVVFSVFMDIGSASEGRYLGSGVSHLLEHMLFKGSKKYAPGVIEDILHKYGGKISGFTTFDYTGYSIIILKEHKDIALDILKEMLTAPALDEKELKKEMNVIEREMDLSEDDPGRRLSRLIFSSAYIKHPYRVPVIGYKDNFRRLDRKKLLDFFNSNYTPEKTVIAIAGDIDKKAVLEAVKKLFGDIPRGSNKIAVLPEEPLQITERHIEEKADIDGSYMNIAFHSTGLLDKDLYGLDLLSFVLGQGESSILNSEVRIRKQLALSVSAYNYTPKSPGLFIISSVLREENVKAALPEILKIVERIKEQGITQDQLTKAKNNFKADYIYQKETIESRANDLAIGEILTGSPDFFASYISHIDSVTLDEVKAVAKKYLDRDNMTVAVLSKSGNVLELGSKTTIDISERAIEKIALKNNLPVLISENTSFPIVTITLLFKGGMRLETEENNGISNIASLMLMDGTDSMSREDIAQFSESKGFSVSAYSGNNSIGITVNCLKEQAEDAMKIISEICLNSTFPEKELEREKNEIVAAIDMQDNSVFNHGARLLKKLVFKRHPYGFQGIGTGESINNITRESALGFYKNMVSSENALLSICGDITTAQAKILAEKYFSDMPSKHINLSGPEREPQIETVMESAINTDKQQSLILLGFCGIDLYDRDKYAVDIMVDMLSSESGILFKNIREKQGFSYATGAFEMRGIDPGYIALYTLTTKQHIAEIKSIISKEIKAFIKKGPSQEEIEKSKNNLKAVRKMGMETNSGFIFSSSLDELYGLGYNNYKAYDTAIDKVTKEDILMSAKKLLVLDKSAMVILKGKE